MLSTQQGLKSVSKTMKRNNVWIIAQLLLSSLTLPLDSFLTKLFRNSNFKLSISVVPTDDLPSIDEKSFIYATCRAGVENLLKTEILSLQRGLKFSFSRPGLLTFKTSSTTTLQDDYNSLAECIFVKSYGISLGTVSNATEIMNLLDNLRHQVGTSTKFHLKVFPRLDGKARSLHPIAQEEKKQTVQFLYNSIQNLGKKNNFWIVDSNQTSSDDQQTSDGKTGDYVINIIVGESDEKLFVGYHQIGMKTIQLDQKQQNLKIFRQNLRYPGGIFSPSLPVDVPSKAYLKIEELIDVFQLGTLFEGSKDVAIEVGSAPGGTCYALLQRGLRVVGIDPSVTSDRQHAYVVSSHPQFSHVKQRLEKVRLEDLPVDASWLLCDVNQPLDETIPYLIRIVNHFHPDTFKGVILTCKLNDELWNAKPNRLLLYLEDLQMKVRQSMKQLDVVQAVQLHSNGQEVCIFGVKSKLLNK